MWTRAGYHKDGVGTRAGWMPLFSDRNQRGPSIMQLLRRISLAQASSNHFPSYAHLSASSSFASLSSSLSPSISFVKIKVEVKIRTTARDIEHGPPAATKNLHQKHQKGSRRNARKVTADVKATTQRIFLDMTAWPY